MNHHRRALVLLLAGLVIARPATAADPGRETRPMAGWTVQVSKALFATNAVATARALELLQGQLEEIVRVVPAPAVAELRKVPLWVSPEYPGIGPKAEYHPDPGWLRAHRRDPAMARGIEFTNVRIFEAEYRRMPVFVLHELAHAYHHRVLGYDHPGINTAYQRAVADKAYAAVKRSNGRTERAYAMQNAKEYFAETTEAFFGTNDFFPFTRAELKQHDSPMFQVLEKVWGQEADSAR